MIITSTNCLYWQICPFYSYLVSMYFLLWGRFSTWFLYKTKSCFSQYVDIPSVIHTCSLHKMVIISDILNIMLCHYFVQFFMCMSIHVRAIAMHILDILVEITYLKSFICLLKTRRGLFGYRQQPTYAWVWCHWHIGVIMFLCIVVCFIINLCMQRKAIMLVHYTALLHKLIMDIF